VCISSEADNFRAGKGAFLLNGEPFVVKAAELHYPRIPRPYWEHRIRMVRALGMNTICMYVFWNIHEPEEGEFDFSGQNDIAEFVRLCAANDMKVIVRPGPYVCAEWEMGGLPWWLLKEKEIKLRTQDPRFMQRVERFEREVAAQLASLTIDKGGPIIMVQVENEYGSFGTDKGYVSSIRDTLRRFWGKEVVMFQCDWASNFEQNGLDDLVWTMNFGTGADIDSQFSRLKELRPDSPLMCSEYWSGWFDKWGASHETRPASEMVAGLEEMLCKGISFSLYMTHGGTSFGHWAGANSPGFAPDVTSYDYDAPITEWGDTTPKYHFLREMMQRYSASPLPSIPPLPMPVIELPDFNFTEFAPLQHGMTTAVTSKNPVPMEVLNQGWGAAVYSTLLHTEAAGAMLTISDPHDYALIYLNHKLIGTIDRVKNQHSLQMPEIKQGDTLNILVEAMGRINFGRAINDMKGITDSVTLTSDNLSEKLTEWTIRLLPDDVNTVRKSFSRSGSLPQPKTPGYYRATFNVEKPGDTFLDLSSWGKGQVYVNGHPLGRFWNIGPQQTLYLPGCWMNEGENEVIVLDIIGPECATSCGLKTHILDCLNIREATDTIALQSGFSADSLQTVGTYNLEYRNGWQTISFPQPISTDIFALEILSTYSPDGYAAIAEIYLLDKEGRRISRENWNVLPNVSENKNGNHTVGKIFDLQESTYWEPAPGTPLPQLVTIDLGGMQPVAGLQILPRAETGTPGAVRQVCLYTRK